MNETAIAFEPPHVRARATHAGPPLDRISVRDYVRKVEIGQPDLNHVTTEMQRDGGPRIPRGL